MSSAFITSAHISSLTAELIQAGTLTAIPVETGSTGQRVVMNPTTEQMEFFDDANNQVASIGVKADAGDVYIADFGSLSSNNYAIRARSNSAPSIFANSMDSICGLLWNNSSTFPTLSIQNLSSSPGAILRLATNSVTPLPLGWTSSGSPTWRPSAPHTDGGVFIDAHAKRLFLDDGFNWREFMIGDGGLQATTGFVRFSNGFQICWGSDSRSASTGFYLPFANAFHSTGLYMVLLITRAATGALLMSVSADHTQVHVPAAYSSTWSTNYIAIGYAA
jgi:hypothetical protein